MTAHEHQLERQPGVLWFRGIRPTRPAIYCIVVGCPLAVAAPPGMPDYTGATMSSWSVPSRRG